MEYKLEVLVLPVADVDRAKEFYERIGFRTDLDYAGGADFRVVHVTPPGSACSIIVGTGVSDARPGSVQNLHLIVADIEKARADLIGRGVEVSEIFHDEDGVFHHAGTGKRVPGFLPGRPSYGAFASFSDPDGNGFLLQEITERQPGR
ncbi:MULTISPECIES: VOC family protein [unclassified Streptomyces]|uniref:VOC family protein n=1 Tax=unclassified Streptomyces TaxID=2593676 RepID=UPI000B88AB19|nr:VOC family protein [Streptomyces sp. DvalAA-14]MYS23325.1 glyoxalase [Streptomyces sp. SID4948]